MAMIFSYTDPVTSVVNATTNRTPTNGTELFYHLIQLLLESGQWEHFGSSDGLTTLTPSNGSNTPAAPGTYRSGKIQNFNPVAATVGSFNNASAWIMLKQVTSGRLLGIQHSSTQSTNNQWKIKYVPQTAAFAAQLVNTAGTTSQMPLFGDASDTGSKYLRGGISTFSTQFAADGTYRFNAGCDDVDGTFWSAQWTSGTGAISGLGALMFDKLVAGTFPGVSENPNDDNDPYIWYVPSTEGTWVFGSLGSEAVWTAANSPGPLGFIRKDLLGEGWVTISAVNLTSATGRVIPSAMGSNPHNAKEDSVPVFYARRGGLPTPVGWKGVSTFLRWNSAQRATGEPLTKTTTRDRLCIGDINLPWDGSIPLI